MAEAVKITRAQTVTLVDCCVCGCAIAFDSELYERARDDGDVSFWCARGHRQHFAASALERLREKLEEQTRMATAQARRAALAEAQQKLTLEELKRLKDRAAGGVCPCCKRTFVQLARHMKTKHPGMAS